MRYRKLWFFAILVMLIIVFSTSCKKSENNGARDEKSSVEKESKIEEETKKDEQKDSVPEKEDKKKKTSNIPHIILKEIIEECNDDEIGSSLYRIRNNMLQLRDEGKDFEALNNAFKEYNKEVSEKMVYTKESMDGLAESEKSNRLSGFGENTRLYETDTYIMRADNVVVSILNYTEYDYTGGNPGYIRSSANFDTLSGENIKFTDVVKDDEKFFEMVDKRAKEDYEESNITKPSKYAKEIKEDGYKDLVWTISPMGVTVYFDTEILGKKTDGPQVITISFEEAKDIFEPKYIYKDKDYVFPVVAGNMNLHFDIDGDGKQENVSVDPVYNQNAETLDIYETGLMVYGGKSGEKEISGYDGRAYLVRKNDNYYMYVFIVDEISALYSLDLKGVETENDYDMLSLSIRDNSWEQDGNIERYEALKETFTDTKSFMVETMGYLLGTVVAEKECCVGDEGKPEISSERGKVSSEIALYTLKDIECMVVDEKGNIKSEDVVVPSDSYILPIYTDNEKFVDVITIDEKYLDVFGEEGDRYFVLNKNIFSDYEGYCYRIMVETDEEGFNKVNGEDLEKIFEGIMYVG